MRNGQEVQEHQLGDWESFEARITEIERETRELKYAREGNVSQPLYRGQRDGRWRLATTLERQRPGMTLNEYLIVVEQIWSRMKRISAVEWPTLSQEISGLRRNGLRSIRLFPFKDMNTETITSFMTYLRQHGFPSPLLDWTSDPYRAAFFAFSGIEVNAQNVAIYTFRERAGATPDARIVGEPCVMAFGPCIRNTSQRHSKQRAQYTWCVEKSTSGASLDYYVFTDHEQAINLPGFRLEAGICVDVDKVENVVDKYTIPASEQKKALASLARRNISKCALFGRSRDALLEDLWNELIIDSAV